MPDAGDAAAAGSGDICWERGKGGRGLHCRYCTHLHPPLTRRPRHHLQSAIEVVLSMRSARDISDKSNLHEQCSLKRLSWAALASIAAGDQAASTVLSDVDVNWFFCVCGMSTHSIPHRHAMGHHAPRGAAVLRGMALVRRSSPDCINCMPCMRAFELQLTLQVDSHALLIHTAPGPGGRHCCCMGRMHRHLNGASWNPVPALGPAAA